MPPTRAMARAVAVVDVAVVVVVVVARVTRPVPATKPVAMTTWVMKTSPRSSSQMALSRNSISMTKRLLRRRLASLHLSLCLRPRLSLQSQQWLQNCHALLQSNQRQHLSPWSSPLHP